MAGGNADRNGACSDLKILHVIPSVSRSEGGPSYAVFAFARAGSLDGAGTLIVTTSDAESDRDHDFKSLRFHRNFEPYKISFSLGRWLHRHVQEFDLVHIHALFSYSSRAAAHAAYKHDVPYIVRPLGVLNRWGMTNRRRFLKRFWMRFVELPILRRAAAIHYTSEAERDEAAMVSESIKGLPSFVVPIPIGRRELTSQMSEKFFRSYPQAQGKKVVLFLARLDEKKGLDLLLKAFAEVKREQPDSVLVIAGSGHEEFVSDLHRQATGLGIAGEIIWTGFLNSPQKASAFSAATVYVLPSYSENFGIAAAEALAAGVPSVLTDGVAIARDAERANAAVVVQPDAMEIAGAIKQLLGDSTRRERLGRNAKGFVHSAFSPEYVSEQLVSEYRKILDRTSVQ